jgi:hypothetical protein
LHTLVAWYEQRAGIGAYCGGLAHEDAERLAKASTACARACNTAFRHVAQRTPHHLVRP